MEYSKPKLFKPTLEDQKRVANELATSLTSKVGIVLSDGDVVRGNKDKLEVSKSDRSEEIINVYPTDCKNCGVALLEDQDKDLFCPDDCDIFYSKSRQKWFSIY